MSSEAVVRVENVSKRFEVGASPASKLYSVLLDSLGAPRRLLPGGRPDHRHFEALKDVSFSVNRGETLGIIGRNGSGKSTLLQIICGILAPSSGAVETKGSIAPLLELGAGFNPGFSGRENVFLNAALLGLTREQTLDRFEAIEAFADIGPFIDQPVRTYSSGMFVRLAFATAIHTDPDILVVDEALSVGDEAFQRKCFSRIEEIKANGGTILFVSHGAQTVIELCDRAVLIDHGEKLLEGKPKRVVSSYQRLLSLSHAEAASFRDELLHGPRDADRSLDASQRAAAAAAESTRLKAYFDPSLQSESKTEYSSKGVRIIDSHITTLTGDRVNCLVRGERYRYKYEVEFDADAYSVAFGMYIKNTTGTGLGGGSTEATPHLRLESVEGPSRHFVSFEFTCALTSGVYFTNSGAYGAAGEGRDFLHRVLDAVAFRVLPETGAIAYGPADFAVEFSVTENTAAAADAKSLEG